MTDFAREAEDIAGWITELRRRIHAHPELGLQTPRTQALVVEELERLGIPTSTGKGCTSVVADIVGEMGTGPNSSKEFGPVPISPTISPGRCVALRADMDGLPVEERTGHEWASQEAGHMHACGHDAHTAMLLGAARLLAAGRDRFSGTVRLLFQPGEEGHGGARIMIEEGALEGVNAAFALHVDPGQPPGTLGLREGTMLASADVFAVTFKGEGGHASMPHLARDPVPAIGPFVDGLSHAAARETDPDDRVVMTVSKVQAGSAYNVIPASAELVGTIRALTQHRRGEAARQVRRIAEGVATSRGLEVEVAVFDGYPPTINHGGPVRLAAETGGKLGLDVCWMPSPIMGAEDFSYVLETVPGAMVFLGAGQPGSGPLHSDVMKLDEAALPRGAALHALMALELLAL